MPQNILYFKKTVQVMVTVFINRHCVKNSNMKMLEHKLLPFPKGHVVACTPPTQSRSINISTEATSTMDCQLTEPIMDSLSFSCSLGARKELRSESEFGTP